MLHVPLKLIQHYLLLVPALILFDFCLRVLYVLAGISCCQEVKVLSISFTALPNCSQDCIVISE